jgi:cell division protein FtsQ
MPRLTATRPIAASKLPVARTRPRTSTKKSAAMQDRLTARTLFFRRLRRSVKPGLWVFAGILAIGAGAQVFRALPTPAPVAAPAGPAHPVLASLAADAGFRIETIQINGADTTKPDALMAAIGVAKGDPIFGLSLAAMQTRLEQLGPVQAASVERALPNTLIITLKERNATAIWQTASTDPAQKFVLIDKQGNVIADQDAIAAKRRDPSLLLLAGADAPQQAQTLLAELASAPSVQSRVAAAERVDGLRWNLTLKNQTVVKLPADGEAAAIASLASLQASMALLDRPVEVIDLRQPGRLVVRPYPADAANPTTAGHT